MGFTCQTTSSIPRTEVPEWVWYEMLRRRQEAERAYASVTARGEACGVDRDEYCRRYIESLPPLSWVNA